eukprot:NODE_92_length_3836_cov_67.693779_g77_i0.p1 GENE.NODE_92_length_3836_cov_67.693779_g77_i0~~NODE_92_length_3836_cov_67.693779_g77_i0.p1  ORF type:complete len:1251 (+),score=148.92 NODE_92_length_3836_cov_67.693779_g77_i0:498-3755(+)
MFFGPFYLPTGVFFLCASLLYWKERNYCLQKRSETYRFYFGIFYSIFPLIISYLYITFIMRRTEGSEVYRLLALSIPILWTIFIFTFLVLIQYYNTLTFFTQTSIIHSFIGIAMIIIYNISIYLTYTKNSLAFIYIGFGVSFYLFFIFVFVGVTRWSYAKPSKSSTKEWRVIPFFIAALIITLYGSNFYLYSLLMAIVSVIFGAPMLVVCIWVFFKSTKFPESHWFIIVALIWLAVSYFIFIFPVVLISSTLFLFELVIVTNLVAVSKRWKYVLSKNIFPIFKYDISRETMYTSGKAVSMAYIVTLISMVYGLFITMAIPSSQLLGLSLVSVCILSITSITFHLYYSPYQKLSNLADYIDVIILEECSETAKQTLNPSPATSQNISTGSTLLNNENDNGHGIITRFRSLSTIDTNLFLSEFRQQDESDQLTSVVDDPPSISSSTPLHSRADLNPTQLWHVLRERWMRGIDHDREQLQIIKYQVTFFWILINGLIIRKRQHESKAALALASKINELLDQIQQIGCDYNICLDLEVELHMLENIRKRCIYRKYGREELDMIIPWTVDGVDNDNLAITNITLPIPPVLPVASTSENKIHITSEEEITHLFEYCKQNGSKYTDKMFVPPQALGQNVKVPNWGRASQFTEKPVLFDNQGNPSLCQRVMQGQLGDCYFMTALSVLGTQPERIYKIFRNPMIERNEISIDSCVELGIFCVEFYEEGKPVYIVVDDYLPLSNEMSILFGHSSHPNELWVPILEKAYAKFVGSYEMMKGGAVHLVVVDLTGGVGEEIQLTSKRGLRRIASGHMWSCIMEYWSRGDLLACGTTFESRLGNVPRSDLYHVDSNGLIPSHAYALLQVYEMDDIRLIKLRNPWGHAKWNGPWRDDDPQWTTRLKQLTKTPEQYEECGTFWISFEDFVRHFRYLFVCRMIQDWITKVVNSEWSHDTAGGCENYSTFRTNPQFGLLVKPNTSYNSEPVTLFMVLSQRGNSTYHHISFIVLDYNGRKVTCQNFYESVRRRNDHNGIWQPDLHINSREVSLEFKLDPKPYPYTIIPSTFHPNKMASFSLTLYCPYPETAIFPVDLNIDINRN